VRYTPEGGSVIVSCRTNVDGTVQVSVKDNGIGIKEEDIPRLTERFYRVDKSRSRATGGTGLGLAIVKHVLMHHKGQLQIESEAGKGSCFTLRFPGADANASNR
jgi:two-component system phosphate regulon sensor histidine kinase PhoR